MKIRGFSRRNLNHYLRDRRVIFLLGIATFLVVGLLLPEMAVAAPGGRIVKAIATTFWGRMIFAGLTIILLPFLIYTWITEAIAERRTRKDLMSLAQVSPFFDWFTLEERATECFYKVHQAWSKEDMRQASEWMSDWYWQNQQQVYLDRWEAENLVNYCRVRKIKQLRPLYVRCAQKDLGFENSRVAIAILAEMEDYLADRETGEIIEGETGFKDAEFVWTFIIQNQQWVVGKIEESAMALTYAKLANEIPKLWQHNSPGNSVIE